MKTDQSVFRDETKLDINYVPHDLPHREKELHLLMNFFSFILRFPGKMTQRIIRTGGVGTGKTVLSKRFGADITREANKKGINLRYVHVKCREYRGSLFLIIQHTVKIFHPNFPRRGYSAEELRDILLQILDEENAYLSITLDEFESLIEREGSEAVYKLTRLQEIMPNKPQRLSFICILRVFSLIEQLDASTRSTLQLNVINLEKYSKPELVGILNDRLPIVFKPLTVLEQTLEFIADLAFSENGNARFAIELLWRSGKYADAEDFRAVTPEYVRKAVSNVIPTIRKSESASLNLHEKLFLLGIARIFKVSQKAYTTLTEIEQTYTIVCEEFNKNPYSHTQLWKYLRLISTLGILKTKVSTTGTRGRSTLVYLPRISASELEKELIASLEK